MNAIGTDEIRVLDVSDALRTHGRVAVRRIGAFEAPGDAVEDLATDGDTLWTSDEDSYAFYAHAGLGDLRGRFRALSR